MAVTTHLAALAGLPAQTTSVQIQVLRDVKNYVTGHELRKIEFVQGGLIPCIGEILERTLGTDKSDAAGTEIDGLLIQAANTISVIAHGGPAFVQPILCSSVLSSLVNCLNADSTLGRNISVLKSLNAVADNLPLSTPDDWIPDRRLADLLYSHGQLRCFARLIRNTSEHATSQQVCDGVLALICKTCSNDTQRQAMVSEGILSALCERLAAFVVAEGFVIPNQALLDSGLTFEDGVPAAAPASARLSPVLETLTVMTETSRANAAGMLANPAILAVLPSGIDDFSPADIRRSPWGATYFTGAAVPRSKSQTPLDVFLPYTPDAETRDKKQQTSFPPLGTAVSIPKRRTSSVRTTLEIPVLVQQDENGDDKDESLLIPWLLYIVRRYRGRRRLVASHLLVVLDRHKLVKTFRSRSFRSLLAPLLIQMLDDTHSEEDERAQLLTRMPYVKAVPSVLSRLLEDDEEMQKIAVDSKAIPKLAIGLKRNFDQIEDQGLLLWRPNKRTVLSSKLNAQDCTLGTGGPTLEARHTMASREGLLGALAAIAPDDDQYRKEICDQGVLTQIMLALEPFHSNTTIQLDNNPLLIISGNSAKALLAACNAIRALTRSVTALRTKLVDADVGKAIIKLMHNTDPEVRIAATKVITNLVIDFSPMKTTISEPSMIKKLCEQVHSANARLRLESIWALKNLVVNSTNQVKREVIDELGANWIRHLIATDPYDIPPGEVIGLVERDYPPRRYPEAGTGDVEMSDDENSPMTGVEIVGDQASNYNKHTVEDDLAIQEQLIDLVRNLFCGESASEIVEYLVGEIGYDEFIKILVNRLRPKVIPGATRRNNQTSTAPRGIALSVMYLIVHIAASAPKFRNMISVHSALIKQIAGYCAHSDHRIRVQVCWIVINLTYEDEASDRDACRRRAEELHKAGFARHMRDLESDSSADVRERAKTAAHLLARQNS